MIPRPAFQKPVLRSENRISTLNIKSVKKQETDNLKEDREGK